MARSPFTHRQYRNKYTLMMRGLTITVEVNQHTLDGRPCTHVKFVTEHLDPPKWKYSISEQHDHEMLELDVIEESI